MRASPSIVGSLMLFAACASGVGGAGGGGGAPDAGGAGSADAGMSGADAGATGCVPQPLAAPDEQWSWFSVPGSVCGYGSQAGFVVQPTTRSRELVIYLMGGGGCYSAQTCAQGMAANLGGYGPAQAGQELGFFGAGSIFDRASAANPLRDATYVFVPYCTGDFHSGSAVSSYGVHHKGASNLAAYLALVAPAYCDATRITLAGSSAGGFGAVFNYHQVAAAFPGVPIDLIDDSGPTMRPPHMSQATQQTLRAAWGSAAGVPPGCAGCETEWHRFLPFLAAQHPTRRFSLISSVADYSIGTFFGFTPQTYQIAIADLADAVIAPLPNMKVFYLPGNEHVWLGRNLGGTASGGVTLSTFLHRQLGGDPGWANVRP